jgi:hypothetical protein
LAARLICFDGESLAGYRVGNPASVSKGRTRKHAESALRFCQASARVLKRDDSLRAKTGVARNFFGFYQMFYPKYPDLLAQALQHIDALNLPRGAEIDAPNLRLVARILGRRLAVRLKYMAWKYFRKK